MIVVTTKKFKKTFLKTLLEFETGKCELDDGPEDVEIMVNEVIDTSRWSIIYDFVFRIGQEYWQVPYSVGATESQDESPWEYEGDTVECHRVYPHLVTSTVYRGHL